MSVEYKFSVSAIDEAAAIVLAQASKKKIFLFDGEMGSGKTTLIKAICKQLKVITSLSSPTFSIVNEYLTADNQTVYHFDLYRINKTEELESIGFSSYIESGFYCFIEWYQIALPFLENEKAIKIQIEEISENERKLIIFRE